MSAPFADPVNQFIRLLSRWSRCVFGRVPKHSGSLQGSESIAPKIDLGRDGARTRM